MHTELIAQSLVARLHADGLKIQQVEQSEVDGNLEITITTQQLNGLKSLTVRMQEVEVSHPLTADFGLLGPDEGFVDHEDHSPDQLRELALASDEEM
jgi:hypothetical protein